MKRYLAEGIGTFCLVFIGTGAVIVNQVSGGQVTNIGISLAFGLVVLAMIYAVGHISGAHLNPAVTLGFYAAERMPGAQVLPYITAQGAGALCASALLKWMFAGSSTSLGVTLPSGSASQSFIMEFILTAILMFVIMGVATGAREEGILAGVAIGATIAFEAIVGGPVSGASMNPARSLGPALLSFNFTQHWIYWIAPITGSLAGARTYLLINPKSIQS